MRSSRSRYSDVRRFDVPVLDGPVRTPFPGTRPRAIETPVREAALLYPPVGASPNEIAYGPTELSPRIVRGGSWDGSARYARCARRYSYTPADRYDYLGFRLLRIP